MRKSDSARTHRPRALEPVAWGMAVLLATAILVQLTHRGIDVLLALAAGFILLALERTLGDWLAESLGEPATVLLFTLLALVVIAYATTDAGQSKVQHFLAAADAEGIQPLILANDKIRSASRLNGPAAAAPGPSPGPAPAGGGATSPGVGGTATATTGIVASDNAPKDRAIYVGLSATPEVVVTGEAVTLRAVVRNGRTTGTSALFTINGDVIATVAFDNAGNASTRFTPAVPGFYTARFRVSPGSLFSQDAAATFSVLPGRRP